MRNPLPLAAALAAVLLLAPAARAQSTPPPGSPADLVASMEGLSGAHPGLRRGHAKGVCVNGEWASTGAGARLSAAPDLAAGFTAPVIGRLSIGGGNPRAADNAPGVRGLAFAIPLPGGGSHHFVMISVPVFAVRVPADFAEGNRVRTPDPATGQPDAARIAAFTAAHPEGAAIGAWLRDNPPSTSYATAPFFGIHTFFAVDAAGSRTPIRWRFEPVAGRQGITPEQRAALGPDYLEPELRQRLAQGPAEWRVFVAIGRPGDSIGDPTQAWPEDREQLEVARLKVTGIQPAGERGACDPMMFTPLALPAGLAPSDDPILLARPGAYGVSLARRRQ